MKPIVVDAGPIIHLAQIKQTKLLKQLPSSIYIPSSVIAEVGIGNEIEARRINKWPNCKIITVQRKAIKPLEEIIINLHLQRGETDVLYLAHQLGQAMILTDDFAARTAAERLNIEVHGTVGLIAYAFKAKYLSLKETEKALNLLYQRSSLFISYAIVEGAIQQLRRSTTHP